MKYNPIILIFCQLLALTMDMKGSEMTFSLTSKVNDSDLVAIIKITQVERGKIHEPEDWYSTVQDFTMHAEVLERIKGSSPDNVTITAYSTSYSTGNGSRFSTAGFSAYSIEPGKSYIAYLREDRDGRYKLSWNSNQFLEVISPDGKMVNDVGQVLDQVPMDQKLRKLRVLAIGGQSLAIIMHPISLVVVLGGAFAVMIVLKRRKRRAKRSASNEAMEMNNQ